MRELSQRAPLTEEKKFFFITCCCCSREREKEKGAPVKWPCGKCILLWSETGATSTMGGTEEAAVAMDAQPEVYYFPAGRTEGEERERERETRKDGGQSAS